MCEMSTTSKMGTYTFKWGWPKKGMHMCITWSACHRCNTRLFGKCYGRTWFVFPCPTGPKVELQAHSGLPSHLLFFILFYYSIAWSKCFFFSFSLITHYFLWPTQNYCPLPTSAFSIHSAQFFYPTSLLHCHLDSSEPGITLPVSSPPGLRLSCCCLFPLHQHKHSPSKTK